jgi:hypothetical protein
VDLGEIDLAYIERTEQSLKTMSFGGDEARHAKRK